MAISKITNNVPYFRTFVRVKNVSHDGSVNAFTPDVDGYYALIGINDQNVDSLYAYFQTGTPGDYVSVGSCPNATTYCRVSTAFIPLKAGATINMRCRSADDAYIIRGIP